MKRKGYFKGRVVEISGSKIVIDTKAETRVLKTAKGETVKLASWKSPNPMPKVGDICRVIFRIRKRWKNENKR